MTLNITVSTMEIAMVFYGTICYAYTQVKLLCIIWPKALIVKLQPGKEHTAKVFIRKQCQYHAATAKPLALHLHIDEHLVQYFSS